MHAILPPLASRRIPLLALLALGIASATMSPAQEGAMSDEAAAREADEMVEGFANTTADGIGEIDAPVAASVTKTVSATAAAAAEVASDAAGDAAGEAEPAAKSPVQPGIGTRLGMVLAHLPAGLLIGALVLATIGGAKSTRTYEKGVVGLLGGAALAAPLGALASYLLTHRGIPTGTLPEWLSPLGGATYLALVFAYFFRKKCLAEEVFAMPQRRRRASDSVKLKEKRQANLFIGARVASIAMTLLAVAASLGVGGLGENPFAKLKPEAIAAVAKGLAENDGSPKEKTPPSEPEPPKPAPPQAAPEPAVPTPAPTPAPAPVVAEVTPPSDPGDGPPPPIVAEDSNPTPEPAPAPEPVVAMEDTPPPAPTPTPAPTPAPEPTPAADPAMAATTEEAVELPPQIFSKFVRPILVSRCVDCHGEQKQKGELRVDTPDWIRKGGKGGAVVVPGKPDQSSLYVSTTLLPDDADIMPAKGDPLSKREQEILRRWILGGAPMDDGKAFGAGAAGDGDFVEDKVAEGMNPANAALLENLRGKGVIVRPLSANGALLDVDYSHAEINAGEYNFAELEPIAQNIFELDLTKAKISDADLAHIAKLTNLNKLELNRTSIGDAGLAHLAELGNLQQLNLYGTQVTDAGIVQLKTLKNLRRLFLYNTKVTAAGVDALQEFLPDAEVNIGN